MAVVSMNNLLESGVHFGHQTKRWNPKMKEYIFTSRDDIYIIDLQKTAKKIDEAYVALNKIAANGGKVLFVGTRKQASEATKEEAIRSNSFYVNERWLGGTLTNFKTIRGRVKRLEEIERMEKDGTFDVLPKKEVIGLKKEHEKLNTLLCGIREMYKIPSAMFIVDPTKEEIAIREARKLNIPVFGIVDTNCDPDMVDYVIPANDDAIRAVRLIIGVMANAIVEAQGGKMIDFTAGNAQREENSEEIMQKALETVKRKEDRRPKFNRDNRDGRRPFNGDRKPFNRNNNNNNRPFVKNDNNRPFVKTENNKPFVKAENNKVEESKTVAPKIAVKEEVKSVNHTDMTVTELRNLAKEKEVKGYSTMKKAELIDALK